jgi:hypothetical protein
MKKINLFIDAGILIAFLIAAEPRILGENIHEWFGVALGVALLIHLLLHWDWVVNVGGQFFKKLFEKSKLKFVIDVLLFVGFTVILFSGLMISRSVLPALGITVIPNRSWRMIHSTATDLTLFAVALHFGLNWKCVVGMFKRYLIDPFRWGSKMQQQPVVVPVEISEE